MNNPKPLENQKAALLTIFLIVFLDLVGFGIVIPIMPYYAQHYGASPWQLGWLMTAYSAMQFFFSPIWGNISDKYGRRPVLLVSIIGSTLGFVILAFSPSLVWLFIGRLIAGIAGANISTANAYIADVTTEENRAKGMGIIGAGFGLGFIFGPAIGGILSRYGYNVPILAAAGLSVINIVFVYLKLQEPTLTKERRNANRARKLNRQTLQEAFGDQRTRLAILLFFLFTVSLTQMEVVFALFTQEKYGMNAQSAGWLLAFTGIIMVLVQGGLVGKLSKKFSEKNLILAGAFLSIVGYLGLGFFQSFAFFFFALGLMAFGNGLSSPSLSSLASKGARPEKRGTTMGVYQSMGSLARIVGPPIAGYTYQNGGAHLPFLTSAVLLSAGFLILSFTTSALTSNSTSEQHQ